MGLGGREFGRGLVCLLVFAGLGARGETLEKRLSPETFQLLMKTIILTESRVRERPILPLSRDFAPSASALSLEPLTPECALMLCGRAQEEMIYLLLRQKFPAESIQTFQSNQAFPAKDLRLRAFDLQERPPGESIVRSTSASIDTAYPGPPASETLTHAALIVTVKDREGKPLRLMLDPSFPQFANFSAEWEGDPAYKAALPLSQNPEGRAMLRELSRYGMYELTEQRLNLLAKAMTLDERGKPRPDLPLYSLSDLKPALYQNEAIDAAYERPFEAPDYVGRLSLGKLLTSLTEDDIQERMRRGEIAASALLSTCDGYLSALNR